MKKAILFLGAIAVIACGVVAAIPYVKSVMTTRPSFSVAPVCVQGVNLKVEVASNPWKRIWGLSMLDEPGQDGMLFTYPSEIEAGEGGFWMYRTRMPLGLAFLDGDGVVVDTERMTPCKKDTGECRLYHSEAGYEAAIELPIFLFDLLKIGKGVTVAKGQCESLIESA